MKTKLEWIQDRINNTNNSIREIKDEKEENLKKIKINWRMEKRMYERKQQTWKTEKIQAVCERGPKEETQAMRQSKHTSIAKDANVLLSVTDKTSRQQYNQ